MSTAGSKRHSDRSESQDERPSKSQKISNPKTTHSGRKDLKADASLDSTVVNDSYPVAPNEYSEVSLLSLRFEKSDIINYHPEAEALADLAHRKYYYNAHTRTLKGETSLKAQREAEYWVEGWAKKFGSKTTSLSILHLSGHGGDRGTDLSFSGTSVDGPSFVLNQMIGKLVRAVCGSLLIIVDTCNAGILTETISVVDMVQRPKQEHPSKWCILASSRGQMAASGPESLTAKITKIMSTNLKFEDLLTPGLISLLCKLDSCSAFPFQLGPRELKPLELHPCYNTCHKRLMKKDPYASNASSLKRGQMMVIIEDRTRPSIGTRWLIHTFYKLPSRIGEVFGQFWKDLGPVDRNKVGFRQGRDWLREDAPWHQVAHRLINRVIVFVAYRDVAFGD